MTEPVPNATQAVRLAIEFLTPYMAADTEAKRAEAAEYIGQRLSGPDPLDPLHVIRGQLYLNELLLLSLAKANGAQPDEYREWAGEWLRTSSPSSLSRDLFGRHTRPGLAAVGHPYWTPETGPGPVCRPRRPKSRNRSVVGRRCRDVDAPGRNRLSASNKGVQQRWASRNPEEPFSVRCRP